MTPFSTILKRAVERTPNAIGGAFADADGEMVDSFAKGDAIELAVMTAHYGVILQHLIACFSMWHFGSPEYFIVEHDKLEVVIYSLDFGYYAMIASTKPAEPAVALDSVRDAARELRVEMGL